MLVMGKVNCAHSLSCENSTKSCFGSAQVSGVWLQAYTRFWVALVVLIGLNLSIQSICCYFELIIL